jgi:hypothetical protein
VLVYGPRKAGTTLFQNLLDGGEELFVYPAELKLKFFVKHPPGEDLLAVYRRESRVPTIKASRLSLHRYEELWAQAEPGTLGELVRRDAEFALASCAEKPVRLRMWAAKEVGGDTEGILNLWRDLCPAGRILFITRDPLMVTRAVLNDRRRKGRRLGILQIVRETYDPVRVSRMQSRHLADPGACAISYEDLIADTPITMTRVADFLGVEPAAFLAQPSIFGEPIVVATASRREGAVFRDDVAWRTGLTARERIIVWSTTALLRLMGWGVDYPALRRRIAPPAEDAARTS